MAPPTVDCPRCHPGSLAKRSHGRAEDGLIKCQQQNKLGLPYELQDLWPNLTVTRQDIGEEELACLDALRAAVQDDLDLSTEVYRTLKRGETKFGETRIIRSLRENFVSIMTLAKEAAKEAEKKEKKAKGATADRKQSVQSQGERDKVVDATAGLGGLTLDPQAGALALHSTSTDDAASRDTFTPTEPSAGQTNQPAGPNHLAASVNSAAPVKPAMVMNTSAIANAVAASNPPPLSVNDQTSANTSASATPSTCTNLPASTAVPYTNPIAPNSMTGNDQQSDQTAVRAYINQVATGMLTNSGTDPTQLNDQQRKNALTLIKQQYGLRTELGTAAPGVKIYANHLTMQRPPDMHVYNVDMIRGYSQNGHVPIRVKKQVDKFLIIDQLKLTHYPLDVHTDGNGNRRDTYWVSDGELIWSTLLLFHATNAQHVPAPLRVANVAIIQYTNEMGSLLTLNEVRITPVRTINLTQAIGQLFYDAAAPSWDGSTPGLVTRGLNVYFTRFARETATNTTINSNKSFINLNARDLDVNPARRTLFAMKGFFLSVRPGVQSM